MRVLIVGAGPGGCATAISLGQRGVRDIVLVDRARFPRDKTCGSAISPLGLRVLSDLGVDDDVRRLGHRIHTLRLTTPRGRQLHLHGGEAAVILLRKDFDQLLVDRAKAAGVRFRDGVSVTGLIEERGCVVGVRSGEGEIRADYVVCADGAHSRFSMDTRAKHTLATIMGWWEDFPFDTGTIEMVFDRAFSPLYGWMFPESSSRVNIGIVVDGARAGRAGDLGNIRPVFEAFLQRHYQDRLRGARPAGPWCGHPISYSTWMRYGGAPGVLYVGEAARLANVATGEGIYQAMLSGVLAADALAAVQRGSLPEQQAWRRYAWNCRRTFAPGFLLGRAFRGAVRLGMLDLVAHAFDRPSLRRLVTWGIGSALTASSVSSTNEPIEP